VVTTKRLTVSVDGSERATGFGASGASTDATLAGTTAVAAAAVAAAAVAVTTGAGNPD
jgi:hypothetical protein